MSDEDQEQAKHKNSKQHDKLEIEAKDIKEDAVVPEETKETESCDEASAEKTKGTAVSKETKGVAVRKETKGAAVRKETKGAAGRKETKGTAVRKETKGTAVSKETKGTAVRKETKGAAVRKETKGAAGRKETKGAAVRKETKGTAVRKETKGAAVRKETKGTAVHKETKNAETIKKAEDLLAAQAAAVDADREAVDGSDFPTEETILAADSAGFNFTEEDNSFEIVEPHQSASAGKHQVTHSGFVAIVGRPNVGKSTLLNALLGKKLAITTRKPHTTRHNLLGVDHLKHQQIIYVDTPGIDASYKKPLNRYMNKVAKSSLVDVDCVLFVVSALTWGTEEEHILSMLKKNVETTEKNVPVLLLINKIDTLANKELLLPYLEQRLQAFPYDELMPISAKKGKGISTLKDYILKALPPGAAYFPEEQSCNRNQAFMAAELLREQLILQLGQELPYVTAVTIEAMEKKSSLLRISAIIWVAKASQKAMIIGKSGSSLKRIGTSARLNMQKKFACKVFLQTWVKVKDQWMNDPKAMGELGYDES